MLRRFFRSFFYVGVIVGLLATIIGVAGGIYFYLRLTRDLPQISNLNDYRPKAVTSIYSNDGTLIAELYEERRYPVPFEKIPLIVRQSFLAAEDANFYSHPGIEFISILRAFWVNLRKKSAKQGASTITQQIVKSLLLSREKTMERKAKEAILSYRLEKALSKDEILSIYLNEIYLGSGAYGVRAAAKVYFHKELDQLTTPEAAFLAGLPQKPSELAKLEHREMALQRQRYVLGQLFDKKMIDEAEYKKALETKLEIFPQDEQTIFAAPYFAGHAMKVVKDLFPTLDKYASPTNPGGYSIYTTVDLKATALAERSLQRALREVDKRQGWRGPIGHLVGDGLRDFLAKHSAVQLAPDTVYKAVVLKIAPDGKATVELGDKSGVVSLKDAGWAKRLVKDEVAQAVDPAKLLKVGDVIEVSLQEPPAPKEGAKPAEPAEPQFKLDQTPELEAAFVVTNALTGEVIAMIGGYDYAKSQFNRVTQAERQPGSSFKPFVYLASLETLKYTPSTIVPDSPISLVAGDGKLWTPGNFDGKFLGPITLRTALQRSRNVVSVYLIQKLGVDRVIKVAERLGITTPIPGNLSISLGSAEVRMIELVRAYGAFAAGGYLADPLVITSIKDRDGKQLYEQRPKQKKVIDENDAFIMAHMMKGVIDRGTATVLKALGRPIAGKTGTTNDQMDAWFIGYTPEWVAGAWVGYDQKRMIGRMETGGKAAAPIFLYFMQEFLKDSPVVDFDIPDGVVPVSVNVASGHVVSSDSEGAFTEYFKVGTEPTETEEETQIPQDYLSSDEF